MKVLTFRIRIPCLTRLWLRLIILGGCRAAVGPGFVPRSMLPPISLYQSRGAAFCLRPYSTRKKGEIGCTCERLGAESTASRGRGFGSYVRMLVLLAFVSLMGVLVPNTAFASEAISLPKFEGLPMMWPSVYIVLVCAIIGLFFGLMWFKSILKEDPGSRGMVAVSHAVQEGAMAYLKKQVATMIWFVIIIAIGLIFLYKGVEGFQAKDRIFHAIPVYVGVAIAFVCGVAASYLAGFIGMMMAVRANVRVANAALTSFKKALYVAFRAGGVSGMATVGLGLLGACSMFILFGNESMKVLIGFGFGGCLAALFMRIGGGIYTKAADVGADLVGKVEQDIPEDDRETPPPSPTTSVTTSATAPVWPRTFSSLTR